MKATAKLLFFIVVVIILCHINIRYEFFSFHALKGHEKIDGSFRVMTYNVNTISSMEDVDGFKAGLIDEINRHNPDILCLQDLVPKIFKQVQTSLDSLFDYSDSWKIKRGTYWCLIYSKKPIRNYLRYNCITEMDTIGCSSIFKGEVGKIKRHMPLYSEEIEVGPNKWITLFSVHLRSNAYSTARRSMDKDESWIVGLPLYYENYKKGQKIRNWEAENLRLHLEALEAEDTPIIIAGDFNDWSGSYCINTIKDGKYKDAWWEGGFGLGITYDEWHLKLRLDHIIYSHHFQLENVYVEKSKLSDHRPLIADFKLLP